MLQYLSAAAFSPFGRLLDGRELPLKNTMSLRSDGPHGYVRCPSSVRLCPGEDMAVLHLLRPSGEAVSFYLDKAAVLLPEQIFAVVPVGQRCTVLWEAGSPVEPVGRAAPPAPVLTPSIALEQLYTLFDQSQPPDFFFAGERHRPYELVYVRQGVLHNLVGGQDYVLRANEALVIPPDRWHSQYGDADKAVRFVTASFSCRKPLPEQLLLRVLPEQPAVSEQLRALLLRIDGKNAHNGDLLLSGIQLLLAHCACGLSACREGPRPDSLRNENQLLDKALEYIAGHTHQRTTVAQLARHCSVSPAYLSLLFQRRLHIAPGAYMLRARLAESCLLLHSGVMTVGQIAAQLCFSSPQHFSAAFKRQYGMTPSAYGRRASAPAERGN